MLRMLQTRSGLRRFIVDLASEQDCKCLDTHNEIVRISERERNMFSMLIRYACLNI